MFWDYWREIFAGAKTGLLENREESDLSIRKWKEGADSGRQVQCCQVSCHLSGSIGWVESFWNAKRIPRQIQKF